MHPHRSLLTLGLSAVLALGLTGVAPATADETTPALPSYDGPTAATPDGAPHAHAATPDRAPLRATAARKKAWPTKKVIAVTVKDNADNPAAAPAQLLKSARLVQDVVHGTFSADVVLKGKPTASKDSIVRVAFGTTGPNAVCQPISGDRGSDMIWRAYGTDAPYLKRDGARMHLLNYPSPAAAKDQFDCAFAETWEPLIDNPEDADFYSGRGDYRLARTLDKPNLKIKARKRVNVKAGTWKTVKVRVRNANPRVAAPAVRVTVKGKKVTSRTVKLGKLRPGKTKTAKVRIKAARGFGAKAKIKVRTRTVTKAKKLRLT